MKKIICLILICLTFSVIFTGCSERAPVGEFVPAETEAVEISARFRQIGKETINPMTDNDYLEHAIYYVDIYTNIIYVYLIDWDGNATRGMITVLYNAAGAPMTLEEFMNYTTKQFEGSDLI